MNKMLFFILPFLSIYICSAKTDSLTNHTIIHYFEDYYKNTYLDDEMRYYDSIKITPSLQWIHVCSYETQFKFASSSLKYTCFKNDSSFGRIMWEEYGGPIIAIDDSQRIYPLINMDTSQWHNFFWDHFVFDDDTSIMNFLNIYYYLLSFTSGTTLLFKNSPHSNLIKTFTEPKIISKNSELVELEYYSYNFGIEYCYYNKLIISKNDFKIKKHKIISNF